MCSIDVEVERSRIQYEQLSHNNRVLRLIWLVLLVLTGTLLGGRLNASELSAQSLRIEELVALAEIVEVSPGPGAGSLAVLVSRADHVANTYRYTWFVVDLQPSLSIHEVADGGVTKLGHRPYDLFNRAPVTYNAKWSPDGESILFKAFRARRLELWRATRDRPSERIVSRPEEVIGFHWDETGHGIYYSVGAHPVTIQNAATEQAGKGYWFNSISYPAFSLTPDKDGMTEVAFFHFSLYDGSTRSVSREEYQAIANATTSNDNESANLSPLPIEHSNRGVAWVEKQEGNTFLERASRSIYFKDRQTGSLRVCRQPACEGSVQQIWWGESDWTIYFRKANGISNHSSTVGRWDVKKDLVDVLYHSNDTLLNCPITTYQTVYCLYEAPKQPTSVVSIDVASADVQILFDPNRELTEKVAYGRVKRIEFNAPTDVHGFGYEDSVYGYLLFPKNFKKGKSYPLLVFPYRARGFQRGNAGDEYPLHVLASKGFWVFSYETPHPRSISYDMTDLDSTMNQLYDREKGFPHLTFLMDTAKNAIDAVSREVDVNFDGIGFGGFSQSAQLIAFMLHSDKEQVIDVAAIGSGVWSPSAYFGTSARGRSRPSWSVPSPFVEDGARFWNGLALAMNAKKMQAPLLMNLPSSETIGMLPTIRALDDVEAPIDVYVYPNEYHRKWQPIHRYNIYRRNLQWLLFWLKGEEVDDPVDLEQYLRWRKMRTRYCFKLKEESAKELPGYCDAA